MDGETHPTGSMTLHGSEHHLSESPESAARRRRGTGQPLPGSIMGWFLIDRFLQVGGGSQLSDTIDEKSASRLQLVDLFLLFEHDVVQCLNRVFLISEFGFQVYQTFFDHASTFKFGKAD